MAKKKDPEHKIELKLENEAKGKRARRPKRWMHRAYCSCGWKSRQRARKGAAGREGRHHQTLQGVS